MLSRFTKKIEDIIVVVIAILFMFFAIDKISFISQQINYQSMILSFVVLVALNVALIKVIIFSLYKTKRIMKISNINKLHAYKKIILTLWLFVIFTTLISAKFFVLFIETNNKVWITSIIDKPSFKYLFFSSFIVSLGFVILFSIYFAFSIMLKLQINKKNAKDKNVMLSFSKWLNNYEVIEDVAKLIDTDNYLLFIKVFHISNDMEELVVTTMFSEKLKENKKSQTPPQV
ncbi:hypothetical protein STIUS_v1c01500 [Spiroplasma sp. TIUS-1]|uniref:hypothetical protein n=1 Tax=Spiroplasma sp. TIUS-1 TaxID=216963 RepID=UPI0013997678|nr:hypothetical protein [Spiroplasma sp. TIUS-1]QHX35705.1 hypothetical protein STIUS_v1c01500 [Spiroplasma sp. TIUS-1]